MSWESICSVSHKNVCEKRVNSAYTNNISQYQRQRHQFDGRSYQQNWNWMLEIVISLTMFFALIFCLFKNCWNLKLTNASTLLSLFLIVDENQKKVDSWYIPYWRKREREREQKGEIRRKRKAHDRETALGTLAGWREGILRLFLSRLLHVSSKRFCALLRTTQLASFICAAFAAIEVLSEREREREAREGMERGREGDRKWEVRERRVDYEVFWLSSKI